MPNPNIAEAGKATRWKKGERVPGSGRKPRQVKKYLKETNLSLADQVNIFENVIATHSADEIRIMIQKRKDTNGKPLNGLVWGLLISWLADCKRGWGASGINVFMRERKFGKTAQPFVHSGTLTHIELTPEERKGILDEYFKNHQDQLPGGGDAGAGQPEGAPGRAEETDKEEHGTPEGQDRS